MSSLLLTAQLIENRDTEKKRISLAIMRDEVLEITLVLNADEAQGLANALAELARQARGKQIILPGGGLA